MAIMLDRITTAASEREPSRGPALGGRVAGRLARLALAARGAVVAAGRASTCSHTYAVGSREFPATPDLGRHRRRTRVGQRLDRLGAADNLSTASPTRFKDVVTYGLLNPFQALLADSPVVAGRRRCWSRSRCVLGGWRAGVVTAGVPGRASSAPASGTTR